MIVFVVCLYGIDLFMGCCIVEELVDFVCDRILDIWVVQVFVDVQELMVVEIVDCEQLIVVVVVVLFLLFVGFYIVVDIVCVLCLYFDVCQG